MSPLPSTLLNGSKELFGTERFQNIIAGKHKRSEGVPLLRALKE